jgi:hypothetical protein
LGQRRGLKNPWAREEDVFLIHPQNSLNGLILNWCTGGCWFTPASKSCEKVMGQYHFAEPNWHVLTFLHPKFAVPWTSGVVGTG